MRFPEARKADPSPMMNDISSADITGMSAGISMVKYGEMLTADSVSATYSAGVSSSGKNATPVKYDRNPAPRVNR